LEIRGCISTNYMESGDEIRHDSQKTDYSMVGINAIIVIMVLIVYSGLIDNFDFAFTVSDFRQKS